MARLELTELVSRRREEGVEELLVRVRLAHEALLDLLDTPGLEAFCDEDGQVAAALSAAQRELYLLRAAIALTTGAPAGTAPH